MINSAIKLIIVKLEHQPTHSISSHIFYLFSTIIALFAQCYSNWARCRNINKTSASEVIVTAKISSETPENNHFRLPGNLKTTIHARYLTTTTFFVSFSAPHFSIFKNRMNSFIVKGDRMRSTYLTLWYSNLHGGVLCPTGSVNGTLI